MGSTNCLSPTDCGREASPFFLRYSSREYGGVQDWHWNGKEKPLFPSAIALIRNSAAAAPTFEEFDHSMRFVRALQGQGRSLDFGSMAAGRKLEQETLTHAYPFEFEGVQRWMESALDQYKLTGTDAEKILKSDLYWEKIPQKHYYGYHAEEDEKFRRMKIPGSTHFTGRDEFQGRRAGRDAVATKTVPRAEGTWGNAKRSPKGGGSLEAVYEPRRDGIYR